MRGRGTGVATDTLPDLAELIRTARMKLDLGAAIDMEEIGVLQSRSVDSVRRSIKKGDIPKPDLVFNKRTWRWSAKLARTFIDGKGAGQ
jgi:hypothetical protein